MEALEKRISLITSKMTLREPFIAAVFTRLNREFTENGTAYTNGKKVVFAKDFCDALNDEELMMVALHEGMHVVLMHMWRRDGRRPDVWNIANDAIINRMLVNKGYTMPSIGGVLIPWVSEDMSSEEVYTRLLKDAPPEQSGGGKGGGEGDDQQPSSGGGGWDGNGDLQDAPDQADATDIEATIMAAAKMAKACGDTSALVNRVLSGELAPSVKWTDVLRNVMTSAARDDYTYRRLNRRLFSQGVYMPALYSEAMGGLVIGVDTSGSVSPAELNQIAGEITAIAEDCRPDWVEVVYCDMKVQGVERFEQGEAIELHPKGGGGTRFAPVFEHVAEKGEKIAALIYLTDLEGSLDLEEPGYPVIWAVTQDTTADVPFGSKVRVVV